MCWCRVVVGHWHVSDTWHTYVRRCRCYRACDMSITCFQLISISSSGWLMKRTYNLYAYTWYIWLATLLYLLPTVVVGNVILFSCRDGITRLHFLEPPKKFFFHSKLFLLYMSCKLPRNKAHYITNLLTHRCMRRALFVRTTVWPLQYIKLNLDCRKSWIALHLSLKKYCVL